MFSLIYVKLHYEECDEVESGSVLVRGSYAAEVRVKRPSPGNKVHAIVIVTAPVIVPSPKLFL